MSDGRVFFCTAKKKKRVREVPVGGTFFFSFRSFGSSGAIRKSPTSGKKGVGRAGGIEQGIKSSHGLFAGVGGWRGAFIPSSSVQHARSDDSSFKKRGRDEQSSISLVKVMFCALLSFGRTACVCAICEVP